MQVTCQSGGTEYFPVHEVVQARVGSEGEIVVQSAKMHASRASRKATSGLLKQVKDVMEKNRRHSGRFQYTIPSPDLYPHQWLWDSCFHAIILTYFDNNSAKKEILSLLSKQFENGLVPHIIFWRKAGRPRINWETDRKTSAITQPPMIAYAAWRVFRQENDVRFLETVYQPLFHYYKYLVNDRDPHERHVIGIINPDESGEDNSPRFDRLLNLPPIHPFHKNLKARAELMKQNRACNFDAPFCMKNFFWVKEVTFNVILVENLKVLARIAETLGKDYDAEYFREERGRIVTAMRTLMLEDGIVWSTYGESYRKIHVKTWDMFSPMFAKIYTKTEARRIIKNYLLNPKEFWTTYPVPSTAMSEPSFDPEDEMWRGPTWIGANWFIHKGLLNYGYTDLARHIAETSRRLLETSGFREQYHPLTGEGQGAKQFTWGGLVIDMHAGTNE